MVAASKLHPARPGGYRELLRISGPLILSMSSFTIMHFCDRVMLTHYSEATAAAATGAGVLAFAMLSFAMGVATYVNTFVAQYFGAGDREMCTRSLWQGIYFTLACSLVYPLVMVPSGVLLLRWIGHEPAVLEAEVAYFTILAACAGTALMNYTLSSFFSGCGRTWTVMWVDLLGAGINIVLNYALIFGHWGMPEMGIRGAAIATVCGSCLSVVLFALLLLRPAWRVPFGIWRYRQLRWRTLWQLLRFGGPSGISFGLDISAFSLFTLLVGKLGTIPLIASNITLAVNTIGFLPMLGLSLGTNILVGQHIGAGHKDIAARSAYTGAKLATAYVVVLGLALVLFPDMFIALFRGPGINAARFTEVSAYARLLLKLIALATVFDAWNTTFSGALKGAGDTWFTMWANVVLAWCVFVPPVYLTTVVWPQPIAVPWAFLVLYVFLLGVVYWVRFARGHWQTIEIRERTVPALVNELSGDALLVDG